MIFRVPLKSFALAAIFGVLAVTGYAARPVAHWDVVPDQLIDHPFKVGVVAFHLKGVKVEFRVNGSLVATADNPTLNDQTGVWEYWFALDPSKYAEGSLKVDARAICLSGDTKNDPVYDLSTATFYGNVAHKLGSTVEKWADAVNGKDTNEGTKAAPYATLAKAVQNTPSGGTVYLLSGTYNPAALGGGSARPYWTTIRPAAGIQGKQVVIGSGRPGTERLKWQGVSFAKSATGGYNTFLSGEEGKHSVWVDNCTFENLAGRWGGNMEYFGGKYVAYVTGGSSSNMANGPGARLIRDHVLRTLNSDAWSGSSKLVVNSAVHDIDPGKTGAHPDFHQSYTRPPNFVEDVILYNVRGFDCKSQGLFGGRLRNSAFVNVLFERGDTVAYSQYSGPMDNVLFAHISLIKQSWLWRGKGEDAYTPTDVNFVNCLLNSMGYGEGVTPQPGLVLDHNNFSAGKPLGTNSTTGDPKYVDMKGKDFHIDPSSPAAGNGASLQCVPADIDGVPYKPVGRNRGCYSSR